MPFGLTNAPSTFQALMNHIFKPHLRKFVLVFFNGILVYSPSYEVHLTHLRIVFDTLTQHTLFVKLSKCSFGEQQVGYLGHLISIRGVSTDLRKVAAMEQWPVPKNIKELKGFMGLTGYYRRFVKGYGQLSKPLTALLKKNSFQWTESAQQAFLVLKTAMVSAPIFALPEFTKFLW